MKNVFRSLLLSVVALAAGFAVSCTPNGNDEQHYEGSPTITVTPSKVSIGLEGGTTEAVTVTTPAEWTLDIDTEGVTASAYAGFGDATVTFEVSEASAMRSINAVFTATGYVSGFPISKKATVIIAQSNVVAGTTIYSENCGSAVSKIDGYWPEVNSYSGWSKTGGEGYDQSGVTYTGKSSSIRDSKKEWAPVGATYASDAPYAYMKDGSEFTINNITINNKVKNYIFSFTGHNQYANLIESPYSPASVS
ncbi:MAG: BACON domain-containing protein, partial [Alistipes sp.]|nr:BACON domain-containing protein [Alistipes sp.]